MADTSPSTPTLVSEVPEWVDEEDMKRSLSALRDAGLTPEAGLFGPGSMYWEINKHTMVYFGGTVPAVLMQLAHPWIAVAVNEHSKIMSHPRQRARMTYSFLWSIVFGDLDVASRRAMGLHRLHSRVNGKIGEDAGRHQADDAYAANEQHAMLWVHLTAIYCRVNLFEELVRPLDRDEKDRLCRENPLFGACFGLPAAIYPPDWTTLEKYIADMQASHTLARTDAGLRLTRFLFSTIPLPLRRSFIAFNSMAVPARTRELLELPADNASTRRGARRLTWLLKLADRGLPDRLTLLPAYQEAMGRLAGREKPDWLTARLNRLVIGTPQLVS